jgi:hypothetical protein
VSAHQRRGIYADTDALRCGIKCCDAMDLQASCMEDETLACARDIYGLSACASGGAKRGRVMRLEVVLSGTGKILGEQQYWS